VAVALDTSITFARAATRGVLTAEAIEDSRTRRTSVCTVRVTDGAGGLVALFRGTAFRKDEPLSAVLDARRGKAGQPARGRRRQSGLPR
jgi:acyl-CoA thioesterase